MSMARATRRSGITLALLGLVGLLFFWVTDPYYGPVSHKAPDPQARFDWHHVLFVARGSPQNPVEAANQMLVSTAIGLLGSVAVLTIGVWLVTRRTP
jgi:hypothetical protein